MATLKDIAKIANVNKSTVSKALNNSREVSEEKKKQIFEIARKLNYKPDIAAKTLAGMPSRLIGIIVPEIDSNYYVQVIKSVESELNAKGYNLIIASTNFDEKKELNATKAFIGRRVDGIVFVGSLPNNVEIELMLDNNGKPSVPSIFLHAVISTISEFDSIQIDGAYGFERAIDYLISLGHRSIGFIGEDISSKYRLPLFKTVMKEKGLEVNMRFLKSGAERFELGGYLRMKELIQEKTLPTAVFAAYDSLAMGVMRAAEEAGLRIPEDMSLVGNDNTRESAYMRTPLTTIYPPIARMAEFGTEMLIRRIKNNADLPISQLILKPELIIRETTSAVER